MFEKDVSLKAHSNFQIGGTAAYFYTATDVEGLIAAVYEARKLGLEIFVLGGGTNILISDEGFPGLVIKPSFTDITRIGNNIRVGAGASVASLLTRTIEESLSGLEWAGGLPGSVGGAIFGNAGAFGGEMKDSITEVMSIDILHEEPRIITRTNSECEFGYRASVFKSKRETHAGHEIIVEATFALMPGERDEIEKSINEKIEYRKNRQPLEYPNIGSIFKNVPVERLPNLVKEKFEHKIKNDPFPVLPNAVLADAAGLKGTRVGDAAVSEKHPNFIVNKGDATQEDVKALIEVVRARIKEEFGVEIEQEVIDL